MLRAISVSRLVIVSLSYKQIHSNVPLLIFLINYIIKIIILYTLYRDQIGYELIRSNHYAYIKQDIVFTRPRLIFAFSRHTFGCE
jgi:hypothetical protein